MTDFRVNVLVLATLGALLLYFTDADTTIVAAFVGALGATMLRLCEPPRNPEVDAGTIQAVLSGEAPAAPGWRMRWNVIVIAIIGGVAVFAVVQMVGPSPATLAIVAAYVGALAASMSKLVDPDEPTIPASVAMALIPGAPPSREG